MVDRSRFDALLLRRAREAGARVLEGDAVEEAGDGRAATASGRRVRWDYLVVADGAAGAIGRRVRGVGGRFRPGAGLQAAVKGPAGGEHGLEVHFGLHPWGYGWVFPRDDDALVGIGGTGGRFCGGGLAGRMPALLRHAGGTGAEDLEGGAIPSGPVPEGLGRGRIYLAGDAAGLADRVSGEGICYAVESGLLVAEAILRGGGRGWLRRTARRGCVGLVRQSRLFSGLLYHRSLQPRAMRRLREDAKFFQGYWDLVAGRTGYWRMMLRFMMG
jgi:flavin-dependent dehydrogenase